MIYNLLKFVSRHYMALTRFVIFIIFCDCFEFFQRKIEKIKKKLTSKMAKTQAAYRRPQDVGNGQVMVCKLVLRMSPQA